MTVPGTDSIVRGELSEKNNPLTSDRTKVHRGNSMSKFSSDQFDLIVH